MLLLVAFENVAISVCSGLPADTELGASLVHMLVGVLSFACLHIKVKYDVSCVL